MMRVKISEEKIKLIKETYKEQQDIYNKCQEEIRVAYASLDLCQRSKAESEKRLSIFNNELNQVKGIFNGKRKAELQNILALEKKGLESIKKELEKAEQSMQEINALSPIESPDPRELTYQVGNAYLDAKLYRDALAEFKKILGYKDADLKIDKIEEGIQS